VNTTTVGDRETISRLLFIVWFFYSFQTLVL
jgi:hypothetical protein